MKYTSQLSLEQKRLWVDYQRCPNAQTNYAQLCYKLSGKLDLIRFKNAVSQVLDAYDLFKTQFIKKDNQIYKNILSDAIPELEIQKTVPSKTLREGLISVEKHIEKILSKPIDFFSYPNYHLKLLISSGDCYYFIASIPHILIDGVSADYLLHDIAECYNNRVTTYFPRQPISANFEKQDEEGEVYWKEKLKTSVAELSFSQKNTICSIQNRDSQRRYLILESTVIQRLKNVASKHQTTLFLVLLSILSVALYKYSHQKKFSILYAVNMRGRQQSKCLGSFVNLIPMLIDIVPGCFLSDFIKAITSQRKQDKEHQKFSYNNILSISRDQQFNVSSYNVLFSKTRFFPVNFKLKGLRVEFFPFSLKKESLFNLSFLYDNDDKNLVFAVDYNVSRYDTWFIDQFLTYLEKMIDNIDMLTNFHLNDVPYFLERSLSKQHLNDLSPSTTASLQSLFKHSVQKQPKKIALSDGNESWTYETVDLLSSRWANYLRSIGIKAHNRVVLLLDRRPYVIILMLALLKLRCAYVPLEKRFPDSMVKDVLSDSSAEYIICDDPSKKIAISDCEVQWISFDDIKQQPTVSEVSGYWDKAESDDLVYILYSSGTTGKPKGIPICQKNLTRLFSNEIMSLFHFTSTDVWSVAHSLAFDFSVWEVWGAFSQNATALIIPMDVLLSPAKFYAFILKHGVTILNQTPSYFKKLILMDQKSGQYLSALRTVVFGAEKLIPSDLKVWVDKYSIQKPILVNMYGLTEATIHATFHRITLQDLQNDTSPIGKPLPDMEGYLLNEAGQSVPPGVKGEIVLAGPGITMGYLNRDDLNRKKFIAHPFNDSSYNRVFCTGDIAQSTATGTWEYLSRIDDQIKWQGYRIELRCIEEAMRQIGGIQDAVVIVLDVELSSKLIAFYRYDESSTISTEWILKTLKQMLPRYMVPTEVLPIAEIPITLQGKTDYKTLISYYQHSKKPAIETVQCVSNNLIKRIQSLWQKILICSAAIPFNLPFFEAGGDSVSLLELHAGLENLTNQKIPFEALFEHTTIQEQSQYLTSLYNKMNTATLKKQQSTIVSVSTRHNTCDNESIAIIGMAGHFPDADNIHQFWKNLCEGKESITFFTEDSLREAGVSSELLSASNYVKAKGILKGAEQFDANFFNITSTEALLLDPQQRCFLEVCWQALEDAGYVSEKQAGKIGVFSGASSIHNYYQTYLSQNTTLRKQYGDYIIHLSNALDFLSSRVSFKLNLTGPSVTLQTGCSTSLVAVCYAARSLLNYECNVAIAGGVSLTMPLCSGYPYQEGMILSPDGHCRAFDNAAKGTVPGNGAGVVVLKRLSEAIADGDTIDAVIRGHAVNNDGGHKLGMTTPSELAQIKLIRSALEAARCQPDQIDYIEAHGTGTIQGDRIELAAINKVFSQRSYRARPCYLGSVKTNIGHLDAAAGIAGLIKTALCLKHKKWVPSLHFDKPNSSIDFSQVPLEVITKTHTWRMTDNIKRAAVSALAVGGTNAHLILEEYKAVDRSFVSKKVQTPHVALLLSAKTPHSLQVQCKQFADFLLEDNNSLENIAYTLQVGRQYFCYRTAVMGNDRVALANMLYENSQNYSQINDTGIPPQQPNVVFLFAGQGQDVRELSQVIYNHFPVFKRIIDQCHEQVIKRWHYNLSDYLFSNTTSPLPDEEKLVLYHLSLFIFQYALAQQWLDWGIKPTALMGHSLGEYVAAALASVWSLEEAVKIIVERALLISQTDVGMTIALSIDSAFLETKMKTLPKLNLVAVNAKDRYTVSGPQQEMDTFVEWLSQENIPYHCISERYGYHSSLMQPITERFKAHLANISFKQPTIPFISSFTGTWVTTNEVQTPAYWVEQLCHTVQFSRGLENVFNDISYPCFLSMSAEKTFISLIKKHNRTTPFFSLSNNKETMKASVIFNAERILARLWQEGVAVDWHAYQKNKSFLKRVHLPTYPFEKKRFWPDSLISSDKDNVVRKAPDQWCYRRTWQYQPVESIKATEGVLVLFCDDFGIADQFVSALSTHSASIYRVCCSKSGFSSSKNEFHINPVEKEDYINLCKIVSQHRNKNFKFIYAWSLTKRQRKSQSKVLVDHLTHLILLIQAIIVSFGTDCRIDLTVLVNDFWSLSQDDVINANNHLLLGPALTVNQEYSTIHCRIIDLPKRLLNDGLSNNEIQFLEYDITQRKTDLIAYRHNQRLVSHFESIPLPVEKTKPIVHPLSVYLITGGLGEIGLTFAEYLSSQANVNIVLLQRRAFLDHCKWYDPKIINTLDKEKLQILKRLQNIEKSGSQVHLIQCDVTQQQQFNMIVHDIEHKFGRVQGVIHAAGNAESQLIRHIDIDKLTLSSNAKIKGTYVLHNAFVGHPLDFMIFCSALSTVLGYPGQTLYNSANAFLDAFAQWRNLNYGRTISINWDTWKSGGMAVKHLKTLPETVADTLLNDGISNTEGQFIIEKALSLSESQIIVSTQRPDQNLYKRFLSEPQEKKIVSAVGGSALNKNTISEDIISVIQKIWSSYFGDASVTENSDFFELGGDSLTAIQMISRVEKSFNLTLNHHAMLEHPKLNDFTQWILSCVKNRDSLNNQKNHSPLICMKKGKLPINLFLVHPIGGTTYVYNDLSSAFTTDMNVYSIQSLSLLAHNLPQTDVVQMAKEYVAIIQKKQSHGPYYLGGLSFGGLLAYEMAQQLTQLNEEVALVVLFDTPGFNKMPKNLIKDADILSYMLQVGEEKQFNVAEFRALSLDEQIGFFMKSSKKLLYSDTVDNIKRYLSIYKANMKALFNYHPEHCHKNIKQIYYFSAEKRDFVNPSCPEAGWQSFLGNKCQVFRVPGNHITLLFWPHVKKIADILDQFLTNTLCKERNKRVA